VHEVTRTESTLKAKVAYQEADGEQTDENLCADAGFVGRAALMQEYGYIAHVCPRNIEARLIEHQPDYKARRWVVESFFSWLKRYRKVHVRYEKTLLSYLGLVTLACALIVLKKARAI
jgi:transposase